MSLLTKGITRLSQIEIDADKDWQQRGLANIESVAAAMAHGDVAFRGAAVLERLAADAGKGYSFLRSRGPGLSPVWQDIESLVQYLTGAPNRAAAFDLSVPLPLVFQEAQQASSAPGLAAVGVLSAPSPLLAAEAAAAAGGETSSTPLLGLVAPGVAAGIAVGEPLGGAVADDGGAQGDETTAANNDTANDMTLLPAVPVVEDAYYFGHPSPWDWLDLRMGTAGNGVWTLAWEYWNASIWAALAGLDDASSGFRVSGTRLVSFTRPGDWAASAVGGIAGLYWIRARVSSYTSVVTAPRGNRAFIWIKH